MDKYSALHSFSIPFRFIMPIAIVTVVNNTAGPISYTNEETSTTFKVAAGATCMFNWKMVVIVFNINFFYQLFSTTTLSLSNPQENLLPWKLEERKVKKKLNFVMKIIRL
jgi:hypothetical protein